MSLNIPTLLICSITLFSLTACDKKNPQSVETKESLGKKLFNDMDLSKDGTQSCASCHNSDHAFIDSRLNQTSINTSIAAVSLGQDDLSLGDINTPTISYAAFVPDFHYDEEEGLFKGGMFLNGRSENLEEQAKEPFLNPVEMQNTKELVVEAVQTKYAEAMTSIFGPSIFNSTESAFIAIANSIAAFERSEEFSSFDSKFDKVLRGEDSLTPQEQLGQAVFIAEDKGNCAACHPVPNLDSSKMESVFTDFSYDNLGVPKNNLVRFQNGKPAEFIDNGLFENPKVTDMELKGAFRVSSLRNIAVTAPYMHNGIFRNLATVVHFYNSRDVKGSINPETQRPWGASEVNETKNTEELGDLKLTSEEETAIVAFLKTLTDERYEHLIQD